MSRVIPRELTDSLPIRKDVFPITGGEPSQEINENPFSQQDLPEDWADYPVDPEDMSSDDAATLMNADEPAEGDVSDPGGEEVPEILDDPASGEARTMGTSVSEETLRQLHEEAVAAYEKGLHEGRQQAMEEAGRLQTAALSAALNELRALNEKLLVQAKLDVVEMAVQVAGQILDREIRVQPDLLLERIQAAFNEMMGAQEVIIHLNHVDFKRFHGEDIKQHFAGFMKIKAVEDDKIEPGGCVIESEKERMDIGFRSRLEIVREGLLKELSEETL